jgi:hypothetical protein
LVIFVIIKERTLDSAGSGQRLAASSLREQQ